MSYFWYSQFMPIPTPEYQDYLNTIWHTAYEEFLVVFDYTGQDEAASRISRLRNALRDYKRKICRNKLRPTYIQKWTVLNNCSLYRIAPEIIQVRRRPQPYMEKRFKQKEYIPELPFPKPTK